MEYSERQIETLQILRKRFFEQGFVIYNLTRRHRKHKMEFAATRSQCHSFNSAIVRLYRGRVRIQFFEFANPLFNVTKKAIARGLESLVLFAPKPFNPTCFGNKRYWDSVVYDKELYSRDPVSAIERAGVHIQKGVFSAR